VPSFTAFVLVIKKCPCAYPHNPIPPSSSFAHSGNFFPNKTSCKGTNTTLRVPHWNTKKGGGGVTPSSLLPIATKLTDQHPNIFVCGMFFFQASNKRQFLRPKNSFIAIHRLSTSPLACFFNFQPHGSPKGFAQVILHCRTALDSAFLSIGFRFQFSFQVVNRI